jgi:sporulation protein YlmC with PRC-barrel domain
MKERAMTYPNEAAPIPVSPNVPPYSPGAPKVIPPLQVDSLSLAAGCRVSKLVGRSIVNGADETVGKLEDLIVTSGEALTYAVLSVGGFLGMGVTHVVVPYSFLEASGEQLLFRNATKESLKTFPDLSLAPGDQTSKIIGATVVNSIDETVGTVDDLIIVSNQTVPLAVLSVGGFLGLGKKYVVVPCSALEVHDTQMLFLAATKEALKSLPDFSYSNH